MGQKQLGLFASFHLITIWRFRRDVDWARESGYPLLRGIGLFWECVLVRSNSSRVAGGYEYNDAADCDNELCAPSGKFVSGITLVLSMLPALFETLVEMSVALGVDDAQRRAAWADIATHVHPYPRGTFSGSAASQEIFIDYDDCDKIQNVRPKEQRERSVLSRHRAPHGPAYSADPSHIACAQGSENCLWSVHM